MSGLIPRYCRYFSFFRTTSVGLAAAFPARERAHPVICSCASGDLQLRIRQIFPVCASGDPSISSGYARRTFPAMPETLPEAPGVSYEKKKSIGKISESNLMYDVSFIFQWNVPLMLLLVIRQFLISFCSDQAVQGIFSL